MAKKLELIEVLPEYFRPVVEFQQLMYLGEAVLGELEGNAERIRDNCYIQICDEGTISYYEKLLKISGNTGLSLEERRNIILMQYNMCPLYTLPALKELLNQVVGMGNYEVQCLYGKYQLKAVIINQDINLTKALYSLIFLRNPAHIELLLYVDYRGKYEVSLKQAAAVRFISIFYPRFNLDKLKLDRTWKLDDTRKLSGYNSRTVIDLYPIHLRIRSQAKGAPRENSQVHLQGKVKEQVEEAARISMELSAECRKASGASLKVETLAAVKARTGDITVYNQNCLDGTWKLNGSRKLNGGTELR